MKGLNSWASGVIVAIIVATIFEMLLPEGNNKKYIKVIIGIYILFTIMSPVVSNMLDDEFNIETIFSSVSEYQYSTEQTTINTDEVVLDTYINNLKEDIKKKIELQGYNADEIKLIIGETDENYGQIQKIDIIASKKENENNIKEIEKIDININKKTEEKAKISKEEINELTKYLAEEYKIDENKIIIV